jgi:hypothetical protein
LNSKNETLHEDFFERHKNHILIDSEELDEGKRKIILGLGFEILNEKEIMNLIITMDKEKFCNPKIPVKKKPTPVVVKRKPEKMESPPKKQKLDNNHSEDGTTDDEMSKTPLKKETVKVKNESTSPEEEKNEKVKKLKN